MKDIPEGRVESGTMRRIQRPHPLPAVLLGAALLPLLCGHRAVSKPPTPKPSPPPPSIQISARSVILVGAAAAKTTFHQCSRGTPQEVDGYWTPTVAQARQLDGDIPKTLPVPHSKGGTIKTADYSRQYIGFTRKGQRFVYVNAFSTRSARELKDHWKTIPVDVCDGGSMFWGMEYDVQKRTFSHLATNGFG